jgi:hypothetical protein
MVTWLEQRFPKEPVRKKFWGDRLSKRNRDTISMRRAPRCQARKTDGTACNEPAMRGRRYCFAHTYPDHYALQIRDHGKRCKARPGGRPCQNAAVPPFDVCWHHGAAGAVASMTKPYDPGNRIKKLTYHDRKAGISEVRRESWPHYFKRMNRDDRAERRQHQQSGFDKLTLKKLPPLYPA